MPITLTDSMEDYLEAVLIIKLQRNEVRVSDIADLLNVSRPSVVSALSALEKRRLITHAPYSDVKLTELGTLKAQEIYKRHVAIRGFLTEVLGVQLDIAEQDACRMEHTLHMETIQRMSQYVAFMSQRKEGNDEWLKQFEAFRDALAQSLEE